MEVTEGADSSPDARNLESVCESVVTTSICTSPSSWSSAACIGRMSASVRTIRWGTSPGCMKGKNVIPMLGITKFHHLLSTKTIHPEIRSSKVISEKHIFFSTIIMSRICYMRMFTRQVARDIRAKDMQIFYQIVTHLVRLKTVQLFTHRQAVGISPISVETVEVTQCIRPECSRQVGSVEKAPNVLFVNSGRPLNSQS